MPEGGNKTRLDVPAVLGWNYQATYNGALFSPGAPPVPVDPQPLRVFDFNVGQNLQYTPRSIEPFGFAALRSFSNVELVRLAVETRKDQIENLDWQVRPVGDKRRRSFLQDDPRIAALHKLFRKPDGATPFGSWLRKLLDDLLVLDAPTVERRRNGLGEIVALDVVDGSTIKLLIDETGRIPLDPLPAYQQVIKGRIWANLTTEDLIYSPRNVRPGHIYGFGPVEQIIVTINTLIQRQASQLSYFTAGNVPQGIINAPAGWGADQLKAFQTWFDSILEGNVASKRKLIWTPEGAKYQAFTESPIKDEFDEWLARIVCYAFSLPPTAFIRQMNRSTSESDQSRSHDEGLAPLKLWVKRLMDGIIQDDFGYEELEFAFLSSESMDPAVRSEVHDRMLRNGSMTLDESREGNGRDPYPDGIGARPKLYTPGGIIDLEAALKQAEAAPALKQEADIAANAARAAGPAPPPAQKITKQAEETPADIPFDRPVTRKAVSKIKAILTAMFGSQAASVAEQVADMLPGDATDAQVAAAGGAVLGVSVMIGGVAVTPPAHIDPLTVGNAVPVADASPVTVAEAAAASAEAQAEADAVAAQIAAAVDLGPMTDAVAAVADALAPVAAESASSAFAQIGVDTVDELMNRVNVRAVKQASERAAEMVGMLRLKDGSLVVNPKAEMAISDSTREMIRRIIADGLAENIGTPAIAERLKTATAFSPERAELIAYTEVSRANSQAALDSYQEAAAVGVKIKKRWLLGPNPCVVCRANAAQGAIDLDLPFESGDTAPPAHPNCVCAVSPDVIDE